MDHLEYFEPYRNYDPHHENSLTRAYLALLRLSPLARASFLDSVRARQVTDGPVVPPLSEVTEPLRFRTQVGSDLGADSGYLASIVITGEPWIADAEVETSRRGYVYDGVILWDDWILIIENKPYTDVWEGQLNPNLPSDTDIELLGRPVSLTWRELISRLNHLLESDSASGPEAILIEDFRRYVDRHFPQLNPFGEIGVCGSNRFLLHRRCNQVLEEIAGSLREASTGSRRGSRRDPLLFPVGGARMAYLGPQPSEEGVEPATIEFAIYPGDTMRQARALYRDLDLEGVQRLRDDGWDIRPNIHAAFMDSNLCWWDPLVSLDEYLVYWAGNADQIRQMPRGTDDFESGLDALEAGLMLDTAGRNAMEKHFVQTSRTKANICPGLEIYYRWPLEDVARMDSAGDFVPAVLRRLTQALDSWGQSLN